MIENVDHQQLAVYVRELLLCGHLIDRASMPHIIGEWGREEMRDIAIDEWMGASPIYTGRMQRLLGIVGSDVTAIFKGMQFDIGAPPQFMDFRYSVTDSNHGEFWLDHCGALMDVEPMGDEYVLTMCHEIEDPTFDATAYATNPRARMRPIHRPPRVPSDRHPHCAWTVTIDDDTPPLPEPEMTRIMATTRAAQLPLAVIDATDGSGVNGYEGPLVSDIDFATFSTSSLLALADEIALQGQLLSLSGLLSIAGRHGDKAAANIGHHQLTGIAAAAAERLHRALGLGSTLADAALLLDLHPVFLPQCYVSRRVALDEMAGTLTVTIGPGPAREEPSGLTWAALLNWGDSVAPLDAIVGVVNPGLRARRISRASDDSAMFEIVDTGEPGGTHPDAELVRFSTGADFVFLDEGTRVAIRK